MTKKLIPKFILFYFSMLILLPVFCVESGFTDYLPLKKLMLPYDYNEAVEKLNEHCGTFPFSLGNFYGDEHICLSDVTGDGVEDLCTFIYFGSGMPRMDIVMLDAVNDKFYTLDGMEFRGAYGYDYRILSVEGYGIVISEKKFYPKEGIVKFGLLIFENGELGMAEFDRDSSEYENAKAIYEKMKENGGLFL